MPFLQQLAIAPERTLPWIVLLPLLAALVNGLFGRSAEKRYVTGLAVGSVASAFALSLLAFGTLLFAGEHGPDALEATLYEWLHITVNQVEVPVQVRFRMDALGGIMTVMVTGIATLIHVYSIGYMGEDPGYPRFMTYLNLFTASMLILVLASNLPLMFVGWEGVGLCSYLLIGFWYKNADYAAAGRKAFVVNRIGDFGVLMGMFLIISVVASMRTPDAFEFATINDAAGRLASRTLDLGPISLTVATAASLCLFLGCAGKSAQIPLYVWLPDAMAGPTPVSALIHAATMVTAGVYLCARLSFVIVQSPFAMSVIAVVGALTALLAATIAVVQTQMKKILAYSTVSQLGFMFAAVGSGAFSAGMFHVFTHAFFKACLFLGAGSVMHAIHSHSDADIRYLGGLREKLPRTHLTFAVSCAAIAGLPLFSGWFSKDEILVGAATWALTAPEFAEAGLSPAYAYVGWFTFTVLVAAAVMTAFYMFRLYFRTFWGDFRGGWPEGDKHLAHGPIEPHESPDTMTVPLVFLAVGAALAGFLGIPHWAGHGLNWWSAWLTPAYEAFLEHASEGHHGGGDHAVASAVASLQFLGQMVHGPPLAAILAGVLGTLAGLGGVGLAYYLYVVEDGVRTEALRERYPALHRLVLDKWRVDELYGVLVVSPMRNLGVLAANLDRVLVDSVLTKLSSGSARVLGWLFTRAQTGVVYAYAAVFVLGMTALVWWYVFPHPTLDAEGDDGVVQFEAGSGFGYTYRWDFDSDGTYDTEASAEPTAEHRYYGGTYDGLVLVLENPRQHFDAERVVVREDEAHAVPVSALDADWYASPDDRTPPLVEWAWTEDGQAELRLRVNGAVGFPDDDGDGVLELTPGAAFRVGRTEVSVAILVTATLEVTNAFGNVGRQTEEVVVPLRPVRASRDGAEACMAALAAPTAEGAR
jgi:NADH-quinone oxidoreductase subunit L